MEIITTSVEIQMEIRRGSGVTPLSLIMDKTGAIAANHLTARLKPLFPVENIKQGPAESVLGKTGHSGAMVTVFGKIIIVLQKREDMKNKLV